MKYNSLCIAFSLASITVLYVIRTCVHCNFRLGNGKVVWGKSRESSTSKSDVRWSMLFIQPHEWTDGVKFLNTSLMYSQKILTVINVRPNCKCYTELQKLECRQATCVYAYCIHACRKLCFMPHFFCNVESISWELRLVIDCQISSILLWWQENCKFHIPMALFFSCAISFCVLCLEVLAMTVMGVVLRRNLLADSDWVKCEHARE